MTVRNIQDRIVRRIMRFRVNKLIEKQQFTEIENCPICDSEKINEIAKQERHRLKIKTAQCADCRLAFHNPMPTAEFLNDFYQNYYQGLQRGAMPNDGVLERELQRAGRAKQLLEGHKFQSILDVGSSAGRILDYLGKELDIAELYGIEPDARYAKFARDTFKVDVAQCMLEEFHTDKTFDCILMMHGLEHLLDLDAVLQKVKSIMHEDSVLYLETPDFARMCEALPLEKGVLISKLYGFSPHNLTTLLANNGFEVTKIEGLHKIHMQITARPKF